MRPRQKKNVYVFFGLPSTQDKAWELVSKGAENETLVIAGIQTKGRGRRGKTWQSPAGGLWFSLVVFPVSCRQGGEIILAAARALQAALKSALNLETRLKLPNDLYFQEKKLAGIILETKMDKAVLGVGLNVNCRTSCWPAEISAVSLLEVLNKRVSRCVIISAFLENFREEIKRFRL